MSRKTGWVISQNTDQFSKYRPQYRPFWAFYPKKSVLQTKSFFTDRVVNTATGPIVQESLKEAKTYKCVRLPEPDVPYKVKSQFRMMCPTGVQCNQNGDVFILDSGASCVHAVERTSVGKVRNR